ncbi:MAG: hypothetical protein R8K47_02590, partial [Mariprofundaceae bacterium]
MIEGARFFLKGLTRLLGDAAMRAVLWRMLALLVVMMLALTGGVFWMAGELASGLLPTGDDWYVDVLSWLVWLPLAWTVWIVEQTARWPFASLDLGAFPFWLMILLYAAIFAGIWWANQP